jgi:hypothetical protein
VKQHNSPCQPGIPQLFDRVFKCLLCLSNRAVISFINGLFGTSYPPSSSVFRPSTETVEASLHHGLADLILTINTDSYLIETQISNNRRMGLRIFQYVMNQGRKEGGEAEDHIFRIKLPQARVIYWEPSPGTPDRETILFIFPDGKEYRYEVPSIKFTEYTAEDLERKGLGLLLPFCVLKYRPQVRRAKTKEERKELAVKTKELMKNLAAAMERGKERGEMSGLDLETVSEFTKVLWERTYSAYSEFKEEEEKMWEDIKPIDVEGIMRAIQERDRLTRERDEAVRKLLEMGVSREQLTQAGLLKPAGAQQGSAANSPAASA